MRTTPDGNGSSNSHDLNITDTSAVTATFLKSFSLRLTQTETEFSENFRKLGHRMDQLVSIMRDVAVLQQQYSTQSESIDEVKVAVRDQSVRVEQSIARVQSRLTEMTASFSAHIDTETNKIFERLNENERKHKVLESSFYTWLNRGLGGWAVIVCIIGALQFVGIRWLENIDKERDMFLEKINQITMRIDALEQVHRTEYK